MCVILYVQTTDIYLHVIITTSLLGVNYVTA